MVEFPEERTYSTIVKTGNWVEEQYGQSDKVKEFFEKQERGELLIQKREKIRETFLNPIEIDYAVKRVVHFGDKIAIRHLGFGENDETASCFLVGANLGANPMLNVPSKLPSGECVAAVPSLETNTRTVFVVKGVKNSVSEKRPLGFSEYFELWTTDGPGGNLRLYSCPRTFVENSKRTTGQVVKLVSESSQHTRWQILPVDLSLKLELKNYPVPANETVLINHVATNHNLSLELKAKFTTFNGTVSEVTTQNHVDGRKIPLKPNHWQLWMRMMSRDDECQEIKSETTLTSP